MDSANDKDDAVPDTVVLHFLQSATKSLENCTTNQWLSIRDIRSMIMNIQMDHLARTVNVYNNNSSNNTNSSPSTIVTIENLQRSLQELTFHPSLDRTIQIALDNLNDSARLTFTRLVLQAEYIKMNNENPNMKKESSIDDNDCTDSTRSLNSSEPMKRADILEFCGLCNVAIRIPQVLEHINHGTPLFDKGHAKEEYEPIGIMRKNQFPDQRLRTIQHMFLKALGYNPEHGSRELKRIFYSNQVNEFSSDTEIKDAFTKMESAITVILTNVAVQVTNDNKYYSDYDQGGVTRVVSVKYSEKVIDATTGNEVFSTTTDDDYQQEDGILTKTTVDSAPIAQSMNHDGELPETDQQHQQKQLRFAREASILQQKILEELVSMPTDKREILLAKAKHVSDEFVKQVLSYESGSERVEFLRSIDTETQRLMAMYKLWEGITVEFGDQPLTTELLHERYKTET